MLDIYGPQRMNSNGFGDPLTFSLAPPWLSFLFLSKIPQKVFDELP